MKLKSIKVKNFRSLRNTDWIKINDLTAFIGENDGGKTAGTEIIRLLCDKSAKVEEGDFTWIKADGNAEELIREKVIILEGKLTVKSEEKEIVTEVIGEEIDEIHIRKKFYFNGTSELLIETMVPQLEQFREDWESNTVPVIKDLADQHSIDITGVGTKGPIIKKINDWLILQPKIIGEKTLSNQIIGILPRVEVFSASKTGNPEEVVNNVLRLLCKNEIANERYSGRIKEIEKGISDTLQEKVDELIPHIQKYYNEVQGVQIDPVFNISSGLGQTPLKLFKAGGGPIELERKGDGKKRQVALGIYEWSTEALSSQSVNDDVILVMDEPDTHMDYNSQRKLYDIISSYVRPTMQVIVCTHSLNLINRMSVNKINHFSLDSDGYTVIESLSVENEETESMFINEIGLSLGLDTGTIYHERCFLIVEGPTESHALPQFFKLIYGKSLQSEGIKLLNGENNGGVRNFSKFLNNNNRNVVFLLDTDCITGPHKRIFNSDNLSRDGFDIDNQVFFIGEKEFEDAFTDETYASLGNHFFSKEQGEFWGEEDFRNLRDEDKFSEQVMRLFRKGKPDIGYKMGEHITDVENIPTAIVEVLRKAKELANSSI